MKINISGVELPQWSGESQQQSLPIVWLVGMRNVGKSTLGRQAAEILGFDFIDLDDALQLDINGYVEQNGWEAFRKVMRGEQ